MVAERIGFGAFRPEEFPIQLQTSEKKPNKSVDVSRSYGYILTDVVIKLPTLKCTRCGYEWHPRAEKMPMHCPNKKCKSPYWNRKRTLKRRVA